MKRAVNTGVLVGLVVAATACGHDGPASTGRTRADVAAEVQALTALGRQLFEDPGLSASGTLSCASCHVPSRAFGPPDAAPVRLGGPDLTRPGHRAVPTLMYLQAVPSFTDHDFDGEHGDESVDNGPSGGLMWDGRVSRAGDQARIPLLSPFEMANVDAADVVARVARAAYVDDVRAFFGRDAFDDVPAAFDGIVHALEVYQQHEATFYPYRSRYDAYLAGTAGLTPAEARGLAAFEDPARGNCASCHPSRPRRSGAPPLFTDFGFIALGVPRNPVIPANADSEYFDLGLCGPDRTDRADRPEYCGRFRTPTLRNVATRAVFFHNGVVTSLRDAVRFYAERDVAPAHWYPRGADGRVRVFDDLPERYHGNVERGAPFGGDPGDAPRLSPGDIDDIVAFLGTLTDGF